MFGLVGTEVLEAGLTQELAIAWLTHLGYDGQAHRQPTGGSTWYWVNNLYQWVTLADVAQMARDAASRS